MEYYLYILYSKKLDRYYTGVSQNPSQRLISHNEYPKGWTKRGVAPIHNFISKIN